jgi:hypothetical protein
MPRRQTRSPSLVRAAAAQPANDCRAVVLADGTRIRQKIKKDYEKALRDLENSRRLLDQFHQTDQPQFTRWLNDHFGGLLTELRELHQKMAADELLILFVEEEVIFGGGSHARAYQRVMEFKKNAEAPPPPPGNRQPNGTQHSFGSEAKAGNADEEADPMAEAMNEFLRQFDPVAGSRSQPGFPCGETGDPAASWHASRRLKELYRAVVRRLHPDGQREMTAQKTEWWHQAQQAYEVGDAAQLEMILTLCEIGESGTMRHTSAARLQRITAQLKLSLREIKRQINQHRRGPAWNFSGRTDQAAMAERTGQELRGELQAMQWQWRESQELIANWKAASEKLKPEHRRRTPPPEADIPF